MSTFFTSDFHLGDKVAIDLMRRPFKSYQRMTDVLIANANARAKPGDTVIHVGDFVSYGADKGIEGARISGKEYLKMFNTNVVLLEGNHDRNNRVVPICKMLTLDLSNKIRNVTVSHYPSWMDPLVPKNAGHIHICGHVHDLWKYKFSNDGVLNINVGVDVWNYQIVSIPEILKLISKIGWQVPH